MKLCDLFEAMSNANLDLIGYFKERPVEIDNEEMAECWETFVSDYLSDANQQKLAAFIGETIDDIANDSGVYYELPSKAKRMFADWLESSNIARQIVYDDPQSAPAWMLIEPVTGKILPKNTYVVHFSDHVQDIKANGFKFGIPDINKIALTREHNIFGGVRRISYNQPGYNFGYQIDGSIDLDHRAGGYGDGVLLFQTSGMLIHHDGDQEQQVVFWGPSVNTKRAIAITRVDSRWVTDGGNSDMSLNRLVKRITRKLT